MISREREKLKDMLDMMNHAYLNDEKIYQWENNYNSIREFIFQPITLDKDIEETIERLGKRALCVYGYIKDLEDYNAIKQHIHTQQSKLDKIEEVVNQGCGTHHSNAIKRILKGDEQCEET